MLSNRVKWGKLSEEFFPSPFKNQLGDFKSTIAVCNYHLVNFICNFSKTTLLFHVQKKKNIYSIIFLVYSYIKHILGEGSLFILCFFLFLHCLFSSPFRIYTSKHLTRKYTTTSRDYELQANNC